MSPISSRAQTTSSTQHSPGSPGGSDDSEATEPPPSSSPPTEPGTHGPEPEQGPTPSGIQFTDRVFLTGPTRSGKSRIARELFQSAQSRRLVIDPHDSALTDIAGCHTFNNPDGPELDLDDDDTPETLRFVPDDPGDLDAYNRLYQWVWVNYPLYVWVDEASDVLPVNGYPRAGNRVVTQGAKRAIGHIACHTRPRDVAKGLISNAAHVIIVSALPDPDDQKYVAGLAGIPLAELRGALEQLSERWFLWWNLPARHLQICPPLDLGEL